MSKRSIFEEVSAPQAAAPAPGAAADKKARARAAIRGWLWVLLILVASMVVVGGLTRLTDSGLSITEWNVVIGALPPLSEADWNAAFELYKTTDEYKLQNFWMEMSDFKPIFWWEWGHRFLGRVVGVVWLLPLLYFAVRGMIPRGWGANLVLLGVLGGLQGAIGWWMVYSGLSGRVDVAPYRLATHLGLAFFIFGFIAWLIIKLRREEWELLQARRRRSGSLPGWASVILVLLFIQILLGALVAGNDAGRGYTDWPLMHGEILPAESFEMTPLWVNFFENDALVQFIHRVGAYVLILASLGFWIGARRSGHKASGKWAGHLALAVLAQAGWGVLTLVHAAPLELALAHQVIALGLLWLALRARFECAYPGEQKITA